MKSSVNIICFCILFFLVDVCIGSDWLWSKHLGSSEFDAGYIDLSDNNILLYATIEPNVDFFISEDTLNSIDGNIVLAKLDENGNLIWTKQFSSPLANCIPYHSLLTNKIDKSIYLFGAFCTNFNNNCGSNLTGANQGAIYITKLDSTGNCLWNKKIDSDFIDVTFSCALDDSGFLFMVAEHWSSVQYDSIQLQGGTIVSKISPNGDCIWAKNLTYMTDDGSPRPYIDSWSLKIKNNYMYIHASEKNDTITIDSITHSHTDRRGAVILKLNLNADVIWYKEGLSYAPIVSYDGLGIDDQGNVYVGGTFRDSMEFEGSVLYARPQIGPIQYNYENYFVKYDSTGNLVWAKHFYAGNNAPMAFTTDANGFTYLSSGFKDSIDFGNFILFPTDTQDMYLARFDPDGNCIGVKHFGNGRGGTVRVDNNSDVIVLTQMGSSATIDQNTYNSHGGTYDLILSKSSIITDVEEVERKSYNTLSIYANPNNGICNIAIPEEFKKKKTTLTLSIFNNLGNIFRSYPVLMENGEIKLNIENEATGMYLVSLTDGLVVYSGKIIFE